MNTDDYIKTGRLTALLSFLFGTAIFGVYFLTGEFELLFMGYGYILLVGFINMVVLTAILIRSRKDKAGRNRLFRVCGTMLLNIPVMLVYCWITLILLGTLRVTFVNNTGKELTDIHIMGCDSKHIDKLEKGESEMVWVGIKSDCAIIIDYLYDGERATETVTGYVSSGMGDIMTYKIEPAGAKVNP